MAPPLCRLRWSLMGILLALAVSRVLTLLVAPRASVTKEQVSHALGLDRGRGHSHSL